MNNKCVLIRIWLAVLALLVVIPAFVGVFPSVEAADWNQKCTLTLNLLDPNTKTGIVDAEFILYHVAVAEENNNLVEYTLTDAFKNSGVSLQDLQDEDLLEDLEDYTKEQSGLTGISGKTDTSGVLRFSNLNPGVYLVLQDEAADGYYPVSSFLVSLPQMSPNGENWLYSVQATPKVEKLPVEKVSLTVRKVWCDGGRNRPTSVTVQLLDDKKVIETVILDASNQWTYTWEDLDATGKWTVQETNVPSRYKPVYSVYGNVITITNVNQLYQTGQLNWPVPVLAAAGMLLFTAGWVMTFGKKKKNEE